MRSIFNKIKYRLALRNSKSYIKYLREQGIKIGEGVIIRSPQTTRIDLTRPSLVTIGNYVDMNMNFQILTHDWCSSVFRNYFHDFINSSGKVTIGNNIYFGTNVTILKGVSIGDNCIIGACSLVTKNIPNNSVAAGIPCKVICTLEEYYEKRKKDAFLEAIEYAKSIKERFGRAANLQEMKEEFIYFVNKNNISKYHEIPIEFQLGNGFDHWLNTHQSKFDSFKEFIAYVEKTTTL